MVAPQDKSFRDQEFIIKSASRSKSVVIREYRQSDLDGILQLYEMQYHGYGPYHGYGSSGSALDYWKWKHENTPLKKNIIVVAENNRIIIGAFCHTLLNVKIGNGTFTSSYGGDLVVHPNFRRQGVFKNMDKLIWSLTNENNVKLQWGFADNPIMIKHASDIVKNIRKPFPVSVRRLIRIRDAKLHFQLNPTRFSWIMRFGLGAVGLVNASRRSFNQESGRQDFQISEISSFEDKIDEFWDEVSKRHNFIVERKKNYLNWRYCSLASQEYTIKEAEKNGKTLGYSVLQISGDKKKYPIGQIVDLLAIPDRNDVANSLVADALKHFDENGVNVCHTLVVKGHPYSRVFGKWGFVNSRARRQYFYVDNGVGKDLEKFKLSSPSKVYLCMGDGLGD